MAYFYRLIFGFVFIACSIQVSASVPQVNKYYSTNAPYVSSTERFFSPAEVCTAVADRMSADGSWDSYQMASASVEAGCMINQYNKNNGGALSGSYGPYNILVILACPSNSTFTGSSCTCTAPYIENSSQTACVAPPSADEQACKNASDLQRASLGDKFGSTDVPGSVSSGTKVCIPTPGTSNPASVGCTMNFSRDITITTSDGQPVSQGWVDFPDGFNTAPCSLDVANPTNDPLKPPPAKDSLCPAGQQMGQINGVDSCQRYGTGTTTKTEKNESNENNDASGKTTEQKDTVTICVNGKCTTTETTTTTTTPTGSSTSTSTSSSTTKVQGKDEYCKANPTSKECDSTGTGGTEDGKCRPGDNSVGCSELGGIPEATPVSNVNKAMTITKDTGWGASNGSCPAPQVLNLAMVGTIELPWDLFCQFAEGIRPIVLGIAYLTAAFTFFGIGRKS